MRPRVHRFLMWIFTLSWTSVSLKLGFPSIVLFALLAGCSKMPPPSPIDYLSSQTKSEDETLVLGRFRIIENYRDSPFGPRKKKSHDWGKPKAIDLGLAIDVDIFMLYVEGSTLSDPVTYVPRDDGTFVWKLRPGTYQIREGYYQRDTEAWEWIFFGGGPSFKITKGDPVTYIGTLTVLLGEGKDLGNLEKEDLNWVQTFVENDVEAATNWMKEMAPSIAQAPTVRLMTGYPVAPADSLLPNEKEESRSRRRPRGRLRP